MVVNFNIRWFAPQCSFLFWVLVLLDILSYWNFIDIGSRAILIYSQSVLSWGICALSMWRSVLHAAKSFAKLLLTIRLHPTEWSIRQFIIYPVLSCGFPDKVFSKHTIQTKRDTRVVLGVFVFVVHQNTQNTHPI